MGRSLLLDQRPQIQYAAMNRFDRGWPHELKASYFVVLTATTYVARWMIRVIFNLGYFCLAPSLILNYLEAMNRVQNERKKNNPNRTINSNTFSPDLS